MVEKVEWDQMTKIVAVGLSAEPAIILGHLLVGMKPQIEKVIGTWGWETLQAEVVTALENRRSPSVQELVEQLKHIE